MSSYSELHIFVEFYFNGQFHLVDLKTWMQSAYFNNETMGLMTAAEEDCADFVGGSALTTYIKTFVRTEPHISRDSVMK